ncbi:hypothetical protein P4O66_000961 [Electrophorus voltai]|uniref:alpha-N-acetylgalactosaminide alpha-2,6-sialyltransferase n=1 Tax=Electrophorus voltai TaxID=2609070 RepID=A0AAD8ZCJ6_9TELE|nr:hypothetical protein P4O66_000961 [Electrophorus voltai]
MALWDSVSQCLVSQRWKAPDCLYLQQKELADLCPYADLTACSLACPVYAEHVKELQPCTRPGGPDGVLPVPEQWPTRFPGSSSFMSGDALEWQQEMTVDNNIDGPQMTANITRNLARNKSCAKSLHKMKDPDFQKAFMPSIQMYLYQNLLNQSEWNRLAHFNNPFGFMEYNYSGIKKVVDLIPKPRSTQLLPLPESNTCSRCAVVANGGILYGSKMGQEIDAHHYVFRKLLFL